MKLELRYAFNHSPLRVLELIASRPFLDVYAATSRDAHVFLEGGERDGIPFRRYRVISANGIPRPIAKLIGMDRFSYELEERFEAHTLSSHWRVIPPKMADRVSVTGSSYYSPGPTPESCDRRSVVEVRVSFPIPLVGAQIEKLIAHEIRGSYEHESEFAHRMLNGSGAVSCIDRVRDEEGTV